MTVWLLFTVTIVTYSKGCLLASHSTLPLTDIRCTQLSPLYYTFNIRTHRKLERIGEVFIWNSQLGTSRNTLLYWTGSCKILNTISRLNLHFSGRSRLQTCVISAGGTKSGPLPEAPLELLAEIQRELPVYFRNHDSEKHYGVFARQNSEQFRDTDSIRKVTEISRARHIHTSYCCLLLISSSWNAPDHDNDYYYFTYRSLLCKI